jgi:spermidine synthase
LIDDAYEYVNAQKESKWDIIFMDINFKADDPNISPPWKFLSTEFLQKLVDISD